MMKILKEKFKEHHFRIFIVLLVIPNIFLSIQFFLGNTHKSFILVILIDARMSSKSRLIFFAAIRYLIPKTMGIKLFNFPIINQ